MRVFFHLLYHQFAWSYDFVAAVVSLGNWKQWEKTILSEIAGPKVLELGHGPGHLQQELSDLNLNHLGIDESLQMGAITSRRFRKMGRSARIVRGVTQNLPFPDENFDQVTSVFPSEYIFYPDTLFETYRVLKPGGKLIILPTAWIEGDSVLEKAADWLFRITGQAKTWNDAFLIPFIQVGFEVETKTIKGPSWSVNLIIAEKPECPSPISANLR